MSFSTERIVIGASMLLPVASILYMNGRGESVEWFSTYRPLLLSLFSYYGMMSLVAAGFLRLITLGGVMVRENDLPLLAKTHLFLLFLALLISWVQNDCRVSPFWGCLNNLYITGKT